MPRPAVKVALTIALKDSICNFILGSITSEEVTPSVAMGFQLSRVHNLPLGAPISQQGPCLP